MQVAPKMGVRRSANGALGRAMAVLSETAVRARQTTTAIRTRDPCATRSVAGRAIAAPIGASVRAGGRHGAAVVTRETTLELLGGHVVGDHAEDVRPRLARHYVGNPTHGRDGRKPDATHQDRG